MGRTLELSDRNNILFLSSALTFDALLAAVPFILLALVGLTHLAGLSPRASDLELTRLLQRFMPPHGEAADRDPRALVRSVLLLITRHRAALSLYAVPLFIWFSTRLFASVRISLNDIFHAGTQPPPRHILLSMLLSKLRDIGMVLATLVLLLANTSLTAFLGVLESWTAAVVGPEPGLRFFVTSLGRFLTVLLAYLTAVTLFAFVYKYASVRRPPWRAAVIAAVFSALGFELLKRLYGLYLQYVASLGQTSIDANLGAVILFVLWVYYTALVFLYGGIVAQTWMEQARGRPVELATGV